MKKRITAFFLAALAGCAPALPPDSPEEVLQQSMSVSEKATGEARGYAEQCIAERKQVEQMLAEARTLLEQAQLAKSECEAMVKKIPKPRKRVRRKKKKVVEKPVEEKKPVDDGLWSPSDRPVGQ